MIQIKKMEEVDIKEALKLHSKYVDSGKEVEEHYFELQNEQEFIGIQCVNEENKMVASLIFIPGIYFSVRQEEIIEDIIMRYPNKKFYSGDVLVIDKEYRKRHLTKPLIEAGIKELIKHHVDYVAAELWIHPDGTVPAAMVPGYFSSSKHLYNISNYYKEYYNRKIKCPVCGEHCICGAAIYVLGVGGEA